MADQKISALTSITGANVSDTNDVLVIVDTSGTITRKITRAELFKALDYMSFDAQNPAIDFSDSDTSNTGSVVLDNTQMRYEVDGAGAVADSRHAFLVDGSERFAVEDTGVILKAVTAPSSASDTGTTGQVVWDSNYIYVCVAANTWKRVAIATW